MKNTENNKMASNAMWWNVGQAFRKGRVSGAAESSSAAELPQPSKKYGKAMLDAKGGGVLGSKMYMIPPKETGRYDENDTKEYYMYAGKESDEVLANDESLELAEKPPRKATQGFLSRLVRVAKNKKIGEKKTKERDLKESELKERGLKERGGESESEYEEIKGGGGVMGRDGEVMLRIAMFLQKRRQNGPVLKGARR
ncbi:hypothetical protein IKF15_02415 [Candidatus Saccharibacteria bacterium]|nr:hypothetical protein [Candidatus Saccharibacteria bacterium]